MKPIILGTAGHIDHGKTALIKALTGIDTDRLKEEKKRGITIELGFAFLTLPTGQVVGIVDVPGHERFVHHMVAGAGGMDLVALVIAADEGVMPQTKEHLDICSLLKVKKGLVVLTKIDLVDKEWLDLVEEDVKAFLKGTFLENSPIVKVSSVTKEGIPELIRTLETLVTQVEPKPTTTLFRLPVDRVFTVKGFGTVVTGTTIGGKVKIGDSLVVYPQGKGVKVRNLQVHHQDVTEALAGQRTAINLQGVEKEEIQRGHVLAPPQSLLPSFMLDGSLKLLPVVPRPLKNRTLVRLHLHTAEILAYVILLDKEEIKPGETGYVQFRLRQPTVALAGDRFVIRSYSPIFTLGGGTILHPAPLKHKRFRPEVIEALQVLETHNLENVVLAHLQQAGYKGLFGQTLKIFTNNFSQTLDKTLEALQEREEIYLIHKDPHRYLHRRCIEELSQKIISFLENFHNTHPLLFGLSKDELKTKLFPFIDDELFNFLMHFLEKRHKITIEQHLVRLATHVIRLNKEQQQLKEKIHHLLRSAQYSPPSPLELSKVLKISPEKLKPLLRLLIAEGKVIRVKEDFYFDAVLLDSLKEKLTAYLNTHQGITPAEFKQLTHASRKYNIPLLEYFDHVKLTLRVGDKRVLR